MTRLITDGMMIPWTNIVKGICRPALETQPSPLAQSSGRSNFRFGSKAAFKLTQYPVRPLLDPDRVSPIPVEQRAQRQFCGCVSIGSMTGAAVAARPAREIALKSARKSPSRREPSRGGPAQNYSQISEGLLGALA